MESRSIRLAAGSATATRLFAGDGDRRAKQPQEDDPCPHPVGPAGIMSAANLTDVRGRPATRAVTVCAAVGALW